MTKKTNKENKSQNIWTNLIEVTRKRPLIATNRLLFWTVDILSNAA